MLCDATVLFPRLSFHIRQEFSEMFFLLPSLLIICFLDIRSTCLSTNRRNCLGKYLFHWANTPPFLLSYDYNTGCASEEGQIETHTITKLISVSFMLCVSLRLLKKFKDIMIKRSTRGFETSYCVFQGIIWVGESAVNLPKNYSINRIPLYFVIIFFLIMNNLNSVIKIMDGKYVQSVAVSACIRKIWIFGSACVLQCIIIWISLISVFSG